MALLPSTLKYMLSYGGEGTMTHHGYLMMGQFYYNDLAHLLGGMAALNRGLANQRDLIERVHTLGEQMKASGSSTAEQRLEDQSSLAEKIIR